MIARRDAANVAKAARAVHHVFYKGTGLLDLRASELDGPVTRLRGFAYESSVEIIVPPGIRVETDGAGVSAEVCTVPPADAPVVHIRGYAYKGTIEAKDRIRRC